jgi:hypothetical protein
MNRTAKCACGAAVISVAGEPSIYAVCHCVNCKRRTGSAFGISLYFKKAEVTDQTGDTLVYAFQDQGDKHQRRHFCQRCGTTLFWYTSGLPDLIGIAGGCFGEDLPGEPKLSATHARKYAWVTLPESLRLLPH